MLALAGNLEKAEIFKSAINFFNDKIQTIVYVYKLTSLHILLHKKSALNLNIIAQLH